MGYSDSRKPLTNIKGQSRVYGATFGVPTWKAYMTEAAPDLGLTDFATPAPPTTVTRPAGSSPSASTSGSESTSTTLQSGSTTATTLPPAARA